MKLALLLLSFFTFSASAKDLQLDCELSHNKSTVFTRSLSLKAGQKNVTVGSYDLFDVIVSSLGQNKIELQIYNASEPSRSYASGMLTDKSSEVSMALWTREFLMEASCSLK